MSLFDDLEESLKKTYNTSLKESFQDLGLDEEERDKVIYNASGSWNELNVDYSSFSNHVFFGSAYAAANFALSRIIKDYPFNGELKEKNDWHSTNTGYENWFYEKYPKQQGYLNITNESAYVKLDDHEGKLQISSDEGLSSFTFEAIIKPYVSGSSKEFPIVSLSNKTLDVLTYLAIKSEDGGGNPHRLCLTYMSGFANVEVTGSVSDLIDFSSSFHVAGLYDKSENLLKIYVNGSEIGNKSLGTFTGTNNANIYSSLDIGSRTFLGNIVYFSGCIDDVRVWNKVRPKSLLSKNWYRTIHANHSGGLKAYYKFNQPEQYGNTIFDYSGNDLNAFITGTNESYSNIFRSGTLGSWFKDDGDAILALNNQRAIDYITEQRSSGSFYDDENQNMIFNLVPSFFIENEDTEYQQLFLLLTARHFDRLKLYIQHLSNVTKTKTEKYNGPPDNLLDITAKHYGLDIGGIYSSVNPLQDYYGENIYQSGTLEKSIYDIRNTIKRNILANISYFLKSKSTREAIRGLLHSVGLNDNIVSISEYTDFSGGIQTTFSPTTLERKVVHFTTSSNVFITSSVYSSSQMRTHQFRFLTDKDSSYLSQSIFTVADSSNGETVFDVSAERHQDSIYGDLKVRTFLGAETTLNNIPLFDDKWINVSLSIQSLNNSLLYASSVDRNGFIFSSSIDFFPFTASPSSVDVYLGTSGSNYFNGHMQEYRCWNSSYYPTDKMLERWSQDWETTEVIDDKTGYNDLLVHLKLNDFTGSVSGEMPAHNYVDGKIAGTYRGFSEDPNINFPGLYIDKFETSKTYDLNVDNDKIRIKNSSVFTDEDQNYDIPFVSIDFSPISSLNKEIMKWMGNLERIGQVVSDPIYQYRDTNIKLDEIRNSFFKERVNSKIDYAAFGKLIKWFDDNFTYLLSQFIPLDMGSSISNYVIEPHILEYNKVKKYVGVGSSGRTSNLEANIDRVPSLTAEQSNNLGLGDPGRYGAFVSASAEISEDAYLVYHSTSNGLNYNNLTEREVLNISLRDNLDKKSPKGYGNGFYTLLITGSDYLKNVLNVNPNFNVSGINWEGRPDPVDSGYLESSKGPPTTPWTGTFNGYQSIFGNWNQIGGFSLRYDGIGYGGLWGQLAKNYYDQYIPKYNINYIEKFNDDNLKTVIFWPYVNSYDGVELFLNGGSNIYFSDNSLATGFGQEINIEEYNTLNIEIIGRTSAINAPTPYVLNFELKFQFFSTEKPGEIGFETVLSSSRESDQYKNTAIQVIHNLTTETLQGSNIHNFTLTMERSLPKQRFMRVFLTPKSTGNSAEGSVFILCKAVLSSKDRKFDDIY